MPEEIHIDHELRGDTYRALPAVMAPHALDERIVSEWPGTKLLDRHATLRRYRFSEATFRILTTHAQGLYDWRQPNNVEDLTLWRESGDPWLVSIAHESDAFLQINMDEREALLRSIPALAAMVSS